MCSAFCGRAACWHTWKGTRNPQMPILLPMNCTIPLPLNAMFDYWTPGNSMETEFSYLAKKNNSPQWQRRKHNCCVILLDLLRMAELRNWMWIHRGGKDSCLAFLTAHLDMEDRSLYYNIKSSEILFPLFSLTYLLLMVIFLNLKTRGFFNKNSWERQSKEGKKIWFSFLFFQLLAQEKSYDHYPNARRLLSLHTRKHLQFQCVK